jgi:predicted ATPase
MSDYAVWVFRRLNYGFAQAQNRSRLSHRCADRPKPCCIDEAKTAIESSGERWFQAETDRVAGEIALKLPIPDATKARGYFERALAVSRQQKAKSLELRAATSMARLWRDQGKRSEAREVLSPAYGWFTEGFDTRDLKEAKALLQELSP